MQIAPLVDEGLGNSSYLVELADRRGLVLDPPRDVGAFRRMIGGRRLNVSFSVETHLHADFVSGSRELAAEGATIIAPQGAGLAFPHRGLADEEEVDLGSVRLRAIATPGHTPEHLAYLLLEGDCPLALFSGGALLPGSVARTDLIAPEQTEALARSLYRALHERILVLPEDLPVYPTHGGGSFCSLGATGERTTTIGRERAANPILAAPDEDVFVSRLLATFGSYPGYFRRLREVNRRGPRVYGALPALPALDVERVDRLLERGAELIDVRPMTAYATGHIPGSLSIALRPSFASWLGWLADPNRPLVFVLEPGQDRSDLVRQALGIGYERLEGELAGGIDAWRAAGRPAATTELIRSVDPDARPLIDVRQASEWRSGRVPGARHVELGDLAGPRVPDVPDGAAIMCGHGERALSAASLVERAGRRAAVLLGGPDDWSAATGRPLTSGA